MKLKYFIILFLLSAVLISGCAHMSHRTYSKTEVNYDEDPEPVYEITLNKDYQNFVEYMFAGNRSESFGTFFNKYYMAEVDYEEGMKELRAGFIANFNPSLDSLDKVPPVPNAAKDKFNYVIGRCSKIIQFNKNTRFLDDAVLLIGKSYFHMQEYLQAERKFNEFLSKLTTSELYDEAILYLGKTKNKLRKQSEGELILNDLLKKTNDRDIKSEISQELAINALSSRDIPKAVEFFRQSIEYASDREDKAGRQFILAKIYMLSDVSKAVDEYNAVIKNTSDFDLEFYAKLDKGIALIKLKRYAEAQELLKDLSKDYRDYPDLKQQADLELANTFYFLKKYDEALLRYYDLIIAYPGTKSSAGAYYYMGKYYEEEKKDYFNALINYKKAAQGPASELVSISSKKYTNLDRYFTLLADIADTLKVVIPDENPALEKYRLKKLEEEGQPGENKFDPKLEPPKEGKGFGSGLKDTVKKDTSEVIEELFDDDGNPIPRKKEIEKREIVKDTVNTDTSGLNKYQNLINQQQIEDSINAAKIDKMYNAYFGMAELFAFNMGIEDSAIVYLEYIAEGDTSAYRKPRAMYMLSTLYRNKNENEKADNLLKKIIAEFPKTELANEARNILGLELIEIETDSAELIYKSAVADIYSEKYPDAVGKLKDIFTNYVQSKVAPKSLYTLGWLYENHFKNKDSAYYYYKFLKERYPFSQYSIAIEPKLAVLTEFFNPPPKDSTNILPDSLKQGENILGELPLDSAKELYEILGDSLNLNPDLIKQILRDTVTTVPDEIPPSGEE
jgi:tetratricopeptide (TPR) repeat protein